MTNVVSDLATLTTISEKTLSKLNDKILYIICEAIEESILDEKDVTELNFFNLFTLYIKHDNPSEIRYRLIPNDKLATAVNLTAKNKLNLLEDSVNKTLKEKFMNIYKDIC